jgi:glycosyltransferase involved in cell wall biosynthesis
MNEGLEKDGAKASGRLRPGQSISRAGAAPAEDTKVAGSVLSIDPAIVYTSLDTPPMRWIDAFEPRLRAGRAAILVYMAGHLGGGSFAKLSIAFLRHYRRTHPQHEVHFLCNAPDEVETFARYGEPALLLNHNLGVSETIFTPLPDRQVGFDAIYIANLSAGKRIELAAAIDRVAYVTYSPTDPSGETRALLAHLGRLAPAHLVLNPLRDGVPVALKAAEVNEACNSAAVGLCLSAVEGAMLASIEYLLAGLPIVTTPSVGGRDLFFDSEYCLTVPPDARRVREAVEALQRRGIPRQYIRERTLAKMEPQRRAFLELLDGILERQGSAPRFRGPWPWPHRRNLCGCKSVSQHFARARLERTSGCVDQTRSV